MWVTMELFGPVNDKGILAGIEYGDLKKVFRGYLDQEYDHRLLLNINDPFSHPIFYMDRDEDGRFNVKSEQVWLPGLQATPGDPTTENLSLWIAQEMERRLSDNDLFKLEVTVWETSVNMAKTTLGMSR